MAALAMVYGLIQRTTLARQLRHLAMGLCFGLGATLAMLQPLTVAEGIIVDGRSLFVGFAAAFLGPIGAAAALVAGSITRLMIGGPGATLGVIAMMISALMGLLWLTLRERCRMSETMCFMALGTMLTLSVIVLFFLPEPARSAALQTVPALLVYNVAGSVYLGKMLQR
ncbi:MAG TPA: GGDEF domain-containing protein, partial [Gemmobacter sp.]|nr:GGDEF domain-containing protein [Gemmobacter sp.]